jgi:serine phosphatase RsbU (regulator of sigma subunit)
MEGVLEHSLLVRPCPGERFAGDAAVVREFGPSLTLAAMIDVTGHGFAASRTAQRIRGYLESCRPTDVVTLLKRLDELLQGSEGAAVGLCLIDASTGRLSYAGAGNTVIRRVGVNDNRLVSREGMVGVRMHTPRSEQLDLVDRDLVLMYSDGIAERMSFELHDGSRSKPTAAIAKNLIEQFGKDYDDAGCIVLRYRKATQASSV